MGGIEQNTPASIDNIASKSNKSLNKNPIAKYKISPYELLVRKPLGSPKQIDRCHCFLLPAELDSKTLLLKTHTLDTGH